MTSEGRPPAPPPSGGRSHPAAEPSSSGPRPAPDPTTRPRLLPGDGWVDCACGARHWGLNGAAGLLAWRVTDGELELALQHRAAWSHHGDTWGVPGGAIADGETAQAGALREAHEESGIEVRHLAVRATRVLRHPDWSYTTVIARAGSDAMVSATDAESVEVRWARPAELRPGGLPLLPAFADSLEELLSMLGRVVLVVDAANVVGSVPDGWWRDRAGATLRLRDALARVASAGLDADDVALPGARWYPEVHLVAEGQARGVPSSGTVTVHDAPGEGDDEIVRVVASLLDGAPAAPEPDFVRVVVATADRGLAQRCEAAGAVVVGPRTVRPTG